MKRFFHGIGILAVALSLTGILSCDSGSSSGDSVPDDVAETAAGIFDMIGDCLLTESFSPGTPMTGMTLTEDAGAGERTMTLDNCETATDVFVSGVIFVEGLNSSDPLTLTITANLTATGAPAESVVMNATAIWAAGESYEEDAPSSISGTFVYNGTSYDMRRVFDAIMTLE